MAVRKIGKTFLLMSTATLGCLHLGSWVENDNSFTIQSVKARGNHFVATQAILKAAQVPKGERIFSLETAPILERVESLPYVERAEITRIFPSTIEITVKERQPIALINAGGLWPVDADCQVLPRLKSTMQMDLPLVSGIALRQEDGMPKLTPAASRVIEFISQVKANHSLLFHQISEFHFGKDEQLVLYMMNRGVPAYLGKQQWLEKCDRLLAVLKLPQKEAKTATIDLRFENLVITRGES